MHPKKVKTGVIGYGYSSRVFHLPLIEPSERFEFSAISTSRPEAVKLKYPSVSVYINESDLMTDPEIELVVIATPNDAHFHLAKRCLENGKHVVIEKPMVTTSSEGETLVALAEAKALVLSVFHNRRWDGDYLTAKKIIRDKSIGDIRYFESRFDRFRPEVRNRWREISGPGSGTWFDLGPHLVDQALCLFGLPESVTARCLPLRENSTAVDYFHVLLHYRGLEVVLHGSSFYAGPKKRFQIEGTKGSYVKYGFDPQEDQLINGLLPSETDYGVEAKENFGTLYNGEKAVRIETEAGCYQQYYSGIYKAIRNAGVSPVTGEDALNVIKILELAEKSSRKGRTILLDKYQ